MFRLGIIGPRDLVEQSLKVAERFHTLRCTALPYRNEKESFELVRDNDANVDGFLFTGFLPYYNIRTKRTTEKPLFYYPISGASLHRVLFIARVYNDLDIGRISIDTLNADEVDEIFSELKIDHREVFVDEKDLSEFDHGRLVNFHKSLFGNGLTSCAITAINSVYESLVAENVPAFRVLPTIYSMRETFRLIEAAGETKAAEKIQIVMQIIDVEQYDTNGKKLAAIEIRQRKLALHQELLKYARKYQACVFPSEGDEFIVLITKGIFQKYSNFYEDIPIISHLQDKLGVSVSMGVGMGRSALEAEENARAALLLSQKDEDHYAYIMNQDKVVLGPIGSGRKLRFSLKSDNKELVQLAEKTNLSISTLTRIKDLANNLDRETISSNDLQEGLNVTLRTANRIIKKLLAAGILENVGLEQPAFRGRPRQVYKIKL